MNSNGIKATVYTFITLVFMSSLILFSLWVGAVHPKIAVMLLLGVVGSFLGCLIILALWCSIYDQLNEKKK